MWIGNTSLLLTLWVRRDTRVNTDSLDSGDLALNSHCSVVFSAAKQQQPHTHYCPRLNTVLLRKCFTHHTIWLVHLIFFSILHHPFSLRVPVRDIKDLEATRVILACRLYLWRAQILKTNIPVTPSLAPIKIKTKYYLNLIFTFSSLW